MRVFIHAHNLLCAAGKSDGLMSATRQARRHLSKIRCANRDFIVGKIDDDYLDTSHFSGDFARNFAYLMAKPDFATRTNLIAACGIEPIYENILEVKNRFGSQNVGVIVATTTSGVEENLATFRGGITSTGAFNFTRNSLGNVASFVSHLCQIDGIHFGVSTACTSGIKAISEGINLLKSGLLKAVIVGGVDSLSTLTLAGFHSLSILSPNPCEPFGRLRDGTNLGEGAAFFIISAESSGFEILACESNCDAFHMTMPREDGFYQRELIAKAMKNAKLEKVDYINLHATGTKANDKMEALALERIDSKASGIKQYIGHTLGAAGAIETAFCVDLLGVGVDLPLHLCDGGIDESLGHTNLILHPSRGDIGTAMNLNFAFGGDNACIIVGLNDE